MMLHEQINQWRVFPRLAFAVFLWLTIISSEWFMALPEPTAPQGAFAGGMLAAAAGFFKFYVESGPKD